MNYREYEKKREEAHCTFPKAFTLDAKDWEKAKTELGVKDNSKLINIGYGFYIAKKDHQEYIDMCDMLKKELSECIVNDKKGDGFIKGMFYAALADCEYYVNYNLTNVLYSLNLKIEDIENNENLSNGLKLAFKQYKKNYRYFF